MKEVIISFNWDKVLSFKSEGVGAGVTNENVKEYSFTIPSLSRDLDLLK